MKPKPAASLAAILLLAGAAQAPAASEPGASPNEPVQCPDAGGPLATLGPSRAPLRAVIAPAHGGELVSLVLNTADHPKELLYRALDFCDRPGWEGKAPVLWPATGRNFAEDPATLPESVPVSQAFGWHWHGQRLNMPIHGFARSAAWHLDFVRQSRSGDVLRVSLKDTAQTRTIYPFGFTHTITYSLSGHELTIRHDVTAAADNDGPMPFSIGNHLTVDTRALGSGPGKPVLLTTAAGRRQDTDNFGRPVGPMQDQSPLRKVPLDELGRNTAVSLGGYKPGGASASLLGPGGIVVTIAQGRIAGARPDAIRFNLWGDPAKGYFAVEPWYGRQNSLADGQGIVRLQPGHHFAWTFTITARTRHNAP